MIQWEYESTWFDQLKGRINGWIGNIWRGKQICMCLPMRKWVQALEWRYQRKKTRTWITFEDIGGIVSFMSLLFSLQFWDWMTQLWNSLSALALTCYVPPEIGAFHRVRPNSHGRADWHAACMSRWHTILQSWTKHRTLKRKVQFQLENYLFSLLLPGGDLCIFLQDVQYVISCRICQKSLWVKNMAPWWTSQFHHNSWRMDVHPKDRWHPRLHVSTIPPVALDPWQSWSTPMALLENGPLLPWDLTCSPSSGMPVAQLVGVPTHAKSDFVSQLR